MGAQRGRSLQRYGVPGEAGGADEDSHRGAPEGRIGPKDWQKNGRSFWCMQKDDRFTGRERTRLRRARENGYLNALCRSAREIREAHSFWCWRLRLPVVWYERLTPRSRFGRVCVDLFTTSNVITAKGEGELRRLG